ncbi:MAG: N utilization substance protein B [Rickettsiales bacterium]|jgi:N utilization substance protein B
MNSKNILIVKKSVSRLMAIQILFQYDFYNKSKKIEDIKEEMLDYYLINFEDDVKSYRSKIDKKHLNNIIANIIQSLTVLDQEIEEFLDPEFTLQKIENITKQILRVAIFEIKYFDKIPTKVIISEYTDIASSFDGESKVQFVNSILENIAKKNRSTEFENA